MHEPVTAPVELGEREARRSKSVLSVELVIGFRFSGRFVREAGALHGGAAQLLPTWELAAGYRGTNNSKGRKAVTGSWDYLVWLRTM